MDALALLRLQTEWGADEALEAAPLDRLRPPAPARHAGRLVPLAAPAPPPGATPDAAETLAALRDAIAAFGGCALRDTATNLVFADGNPAAGLLFVGEAPTAAEDRSGRAFDGPAGAYLERMLASIRLDRETALFTPLIPWRPPGGRPPTAAEVAACLPFLHRLIVLTSPRRMVLLGSLAQRAILGAAPRKRSGAWLPATVPGRANPLPALAFPSPELLLAKPAGRRDAWADLRLLRRSIDEDIAKI
jgi:uracil-DNA glycosylase family 4